MSITASATRAPGTIWWARLGETPGRVGELLGTPSPTSSRDPAAAGRRASVPGDQWSVARWAPRRRCGPATGTSWTSPPRHRVAPRAGGGRRPGRCRRGSSCAAPGCGSRRGARRRSSSRASRAAPKRHRPGHVGLLVGAARDLERAAADVEDGQPPGRPPEPAAYGEEGQPRLVVTGQHRDPHPGLVGARGRARRRSCARRGRPTSRTPACPGRPCPRPRRRRRPRTRSAP